MSTYYILFEYIYVISHPLKFNHAVNLESIDYVIINSFTDRTQEMSVPYLAPN